jgi:phosphoribosylglycinamide formyltransferase-1
VNIHPALLPKFGGKGMYGDHVHRAVIAAGERESGITIHYVNAEYDSGSTIFQATCPVLPGDTPESLAARIHGLEHEHFPRVVEEVVDLLPPAGYRKQ